MWSILLFPLIEVTNNFKINNQVSLTRRVSIEIHSNYCEIKTIPVFNGALRDYKWQIISHRECFSNRLIINIFILHTNYSFHAQMCFYYIHSKRTILMEEVLCKISHRNSIWWCHQYPLIVPLSMLPSCRKACINPLGILS